MFLSDLEYLFQGDYNFGGRNMEKDARTLAVEFALSELAAESIVPEIDRNANILELEADLVPMVGTYRGDWAEREAERLFVNASIGVCA